MFAIVEKRFIRKKHKKKKKTLPLKFTGRVTSASPKYHFYDIKFHVLHQIHISIINIELDYEAHNHRRVVPCLNIEQEVL